MVNKLVKIEGLMKRFKLNPCKRCIVELERALFMMRENKTIEVTITELSDSDCSNKNNHFICFGVYKEE
jgi:hypothetical protein